MSVLFMGASSCSGPGVKVWYLDPDQGLVRKQDNEILPFSQARGYYCMSKQDAEYVMNRCIGPKTEVERRALWDYLLQHD